MHEDSFKMLAALAVVALGLGLSACASDQNATAGSDVKSSQSSVERYFDDAGFAADAVSKLKQDLRKYLAQVFSKPRHSPKAVRRTISAPYSS